MNARAYAPRERRRDVASWAGAVVAVAGLAVVAWALVSSWGGVVHSHPAYLAVLVAGAVLAALALTLTLRRRRRRGGIRFAGRLLIAVIGLVGVALLAWLRPYSAGEAAAAAMVSDDAVTVTDSADRIVLAPQDGTDKTGVFFQPGALVDPRAYAAVLRPLAEGGHPVVIAKQPLGIAFLATGAFDDAREEHPEVSAWMVGGHSLGGTGADDAAGLVFFASYPASDLSATDVPVLSISGTNDALATPEKIDASRSDLPADATFVVLEGVAHAQFGDYGAQAGDGTPSIGDAEARDQIASETVEFVDGVTG